MLATQDGEREAHAPRRILEQGLVVGDWVVGRVGDPGQPPQPAQPARPTDEGAASPWWIEERLERRTCLTRRAAGGDGRAQVLAANVDVVVILAGLDQEFNLQRIERWLCLAHEGGCTPLVLLSKAGLVSEEVRRERVAAVERVALGVEVLAVDVVDRLGLPELDAALPPGQTIVLVGSSGVGKSTLLNYLSGGDVMRTGVVSAAHGKGRHTTSHRELVVLEERELVVLDTPGLREVGLWGAGEGLARTFAEVAELALGCRFSDCTHGAEPGCAVREAVEAGAVDERRVRAHARLAEEQAKTERRASTHQRRADERRFAKTVRDAVERKKRKRG